MKKLVPIIIAIIMVGSGAFYGGMKYAESNRSGRGGLSQADFQNLQNLSPEERQQRLQELGANIGGFRARTGGQQGGGFANGEIIAKDDETVTIKLHDGGSKIVFFSESTKLTKTTEGSLSNLEIGKTVLVSGKPNPDGSFTAETIQINPLMSIPQQPKE